MIWIVNAKQSSLAFVLHALRIRAHASRGQHGTAKKEKNPVDDVDSTASSVGGYGI